MPFEFKPMPEMPEIVVIEPRVFGDERGWFQETFKESDFAKHGIRGPFMQDNHSRSVGKGTLRGLHYQKEPAEQGKLVRCLRGEIFDVAVDIRKGSPTYLRHVSVVLSEQNHKIIWIPAGFAHGVQALTDEVEIAYKATKEYSVPHDRSIRWDDPQIGVRWPLPPAALSKKDLEAPLLKDADANFTWKGH